MRDVVFTVHWLLGLVACVVLGIVGVTGAILSFETETIAALNPGIVTIAPTDAPRLAPPDLLARLVHNQPDRRIVSLEIASGDRAPRVGFAPSSNADGRGERRIDWRYVDPASGTLLPAPRGESLFRTTREVHRYLAAGEVGKQIVGACTVALIVLVISGMYMRWPRDPHSWRAWTVVDFALRGRALLYRLHAVVGTWVLPVYLVVALTGLTWSYEWYRGAVLSALGAPAPTRPSAQPPRSPNDAPIDVAAALRTAWPTFAARGVAFDIATVTLPDALGRRLEIRYLPGDALHERAFDRLAIDPASGSVVADERFANRSVGARLAAGIFPLHRGSFFGATGVVVTMVASLLMPLFAVTGLLMYSARRRGKRAFRRRPVEST
jgi:sulfite reductase (NADPH) flavoprotein alpha-component